MEHKMVKKIPTGGRQTSWLLYKCGQGCDFRTTKKKIQLVVRAGLELRPQKFQAQCSNYLATLSSSPNISNNYCT